MVQADSIAKGRFVVPSVVSSHFHVRQGDAVADFGAGSGYFVEVLSQLVGPSGRVYACEIQRELVERIGQLVRSKGLSNVDPLWCDLEEDQGIKIADGVVDIGIVVNTLFQLEDREVALREMGRTLRNGAKMFVIDWSESFGGLGPHPTQVVSESDAQALLESNGFVYERSFDAGDHHYGLAFRKA